MTLHVERLENRQMLAGNVVASLDGETLVILGDEADQGVVLTYDSTAQKYRVIGRDAGGGPTTVNDLDTSQPGNVVEFSGVKQVAVNLAGGNDKFEVGSPQAVDTVISKWLWIGMGDGDDEVVLGRAGNAAGGADPVATSLRTGKSVQVFLGAGNDKLQIANADIGLWLNIFAEDGNDEVTFATSFTPAGQTEPTLFPVRVRGRSAINLGNGDDLLEVHNAIFHGDLRILDPAGVSTLDLHNVHVSKKLDIDTGGSEDEIVIDFVQAKQFTLDTNSGIDDVNITNARFKTMTIKLGDARDQLLLRNVRVSWITRLDGGVGGSALTRGPGNQLRGLTQRNMG
jgi:hypothetical protein